MRVSFLLLLAVLSLAAPGAAAQVPLPACDNFAGREVFAELYGVTTGYFTVYRATDFGFVGGGTIYSRAGCDFIWEVSGNIDPGSPADITCTYGQAPCNDARGLYLLFISGDVYLYAPFASNSVNPVSFYNPYVGGTASPDVGFGIFATSGGATQVKAIQGLPLTSTSSPSYYENVLPNGYVMPYDAQTAGQQGGNGVLPGFFLTKVATGCPNPQFTAGTCGTDPRSYRFAPQGDVRLPGPGPHVWDLTGITLSFGASSRLVLDQPITVTGGTLTERDAAQGWAGVRVTGSTATLSGNATVERVGQASNSFAPPPAANVIVSGGGHVVLDGARLRDSGTGGGLLVGGQGSTGRVLGSTRITGNAGAAGVLATSGGLVTVESDDVRITGNAEGVAATGSGSRVTVTAGRILNNPGPGVRASGGGRIDVLRYTGTTPPVTPTTPTIVDNNIGGLYASSTGKTGGGLVFTGERVYECDPSGCLDPSVGNHNVTANNLGAAFDIRSRGGSGVFVPENYWGTSDPNAVERDSDGSGYLVYLPIRTAPAGLTGGAPLARGVMPGAPSVLSGDAGPAARVRDDVLALVGQAEGGVRAGNGDAAAGLLAEAWALADTDEDRLAVSEAAGRTLATVEPAALVAWSMTAGAWGARARAAGLVGQGRAPEAVALATALAATPGTDAASEGHRVRGLGLLVEAAVAVGDAASAVSALEALAAADPEGAADLAVSVALALPNAGLTLGRGAAGALVAAGLAATAEPATDVSLAIGPNPSPGAVRVTLTGATASEAEIAVYDALGRRVAVLQDGLVTADAVVTFDGSAHPAGVYVVRAVVRGAAGTSVLTRTVTVVR